MSLELKIFKETSWLAFFKLISQVFSWISTIIIARILVPGDYGLMAMSTVITGYAMIFSELGLGAAIIQRTDPTQSELSSCFWFTVLSSFFLALACFLIAYPTAAIFHEPKVIPITQAVSVLFIISGIQIVPLNLMKKELSFKRIGQIEVYTTLISCIFMLVIAYMDGGVWTLIGGHIIRNATRVQFIYHYEKWRPSFTFNFNEAKSYLHFGLPLVIGESLNYVYTRSDKFFAGRVWSPGMLGLYTFALELSQIPTDKIVALINQVSFPAFSRIKDDMERFRSLYLNMIKFTALIVLPIFVGGYITGEDIIKVLLNEKWYPMIFCFKLLCLTEMITALNALNNFIHGAQGAPRRFLFFNMIMAAILPLSFYLSVPYGLNAILIPWFTSYTFICVGWIIYSIRKVGITVANYLKALNVPVLSTFIMTLVVLCSKYLLQQIFEPSYLLLLSLAIQVTLGGLAYLGSVWVLDRDIFFSIKRLRET